jgi:hypothetical protein
MLNQKRKSVYEMKKVLCDESAKQSCINNQLSFDKINKVFNKQYCGKLGLFLIAFFFENKLFIFLFDESLF